MSKGERKKESKTRSVGNTMYCYLQEEFIARKEVSSTIVTQKSRKFPHAEGLDWEDKRMHVLYENAVGNKEIASCSICSLTFSLFGWLPLFETRLLLWWMNMVC